MPNDYASWCFRHGRYEDSLFCPACLRGEDSFFSEEGTGYPKGSSRERHPPDTYSWDPPPPPPPLEPPTPAVEKKGTSRRSRRSLEEKVDILIARWRSQGILGGITF